jgi:hypothetical protein
VAWRAAARNKLREQNNFERAESRTSLDMGSGSTYGLTVSDSRSRARGLSACSVSKLTVGLSVSDLWLRTHGLGLLVSDPWFLVHNVGSRIQCTYTEVCYKVYGRLLAYASCGASVKLPQLVHGSGAHLALRFMRCRVPERITPPAVVEGRGAQPSVMQEDHTSQQPTPFS